VAAARILIVDDNPVNLAVFEELLEQDYETLSVESGEQAMAVAPDFEPHLVLLDVMMPGIDGYETCRWIRSRPELSHTRVIMVSAKAMCGDIDSGMRSGANKYVTKPFALSSLRDVIKAELSHRNGNGL
jgi:CheY-like chemotaxis protein